MQKYRKYLENTKSFSENATIDQSIAYGLLCAKRYFEYYQSFHDNEGFGDLNTLKAINEIAESHLLSSSTRHDAITLKEKIDSAIPDSEEYSDCSDAMDCGCIYFYLISYICDNNSENIKNIADLIYDISDRYAQESLNITQYDSDIESQIESHKIVQTNIANEVAIFNDILSCMDKIKLLEYINLKSQHPLMLE